MKKLVFSLFFISVSWASQCQDWDWTVQHKPTGHQLHTMGKIYDNGVFRYVGVTYFYYSYYKDKCFGRMDQYRFNPEYVETGVRDDNGVLGRLIYDDFTPFEILRDTILPDGTLSRVYSTVKDYHPCYGYYPNQWCFLRLPDGVQLLLPCGAEYIYPTGMEPDIYNRAPRLLKVTGIDACSLPIVETPNGYAKWRDSEYYPSLNAKPDPEPTLEPPPDPCTITVNGKTISLYGRVQVVSSFGDIKVAESSIPDLYVATVSSPTKCGEWVFVDSNPDFTIEYSSFPDLKIQFSSFPGLR